MSGFTAFLGKELREIPRTWRLWVLPGLLVFMAVLSPVIAQLTPALLKSVSGSMPGVVLKVPDPTALDANMQWIKNLSQMALTVAVAMTAASVASERSQGTTILVLTKPVSRAGFVIAKFFSQALLLFAATLVGGLVFVALTQGVFGEVRLGGFLASTAAWLAFTLALMAVALVLSSSLNTIAAVVVSVFLSPLLSILSLWQPTRDYSPVGLVTAMNDLAVGKDVEWLWPMVTSGVVVLIGVALAVMVFRTREL